MSDTRFPRLHTSLLADAAGVPVGTVIWYLGKATDITEENMPGWMIADGSQLATARYPKLAEIMNAAANETFNLPILTDGRFIKGSAGTSSDAARTTYAAGIPNITAHFAAATSGYLEVGEWGGAICRAYNNGGNDDGTGHKYSISVFIFDASQGLSSSDEPVYGRSNTVTPRSMTAIPLIKVR